MLIEILFDYLLKDVCIFINSRVNVISIALHCSCIVTGNRAGLAYSLTSAKYCANYPGDYTKFHARLN